MTPSKVVYPADKNPDKNKQKADSAACVIFCTNFVGFYICSSCILASQLLTEKLKYMFVLNCMFCKYILGESNCICGFLQLFSFVSLCVKLLFGKFVLREFNCIYFLQIYGFLAILRFLAIFCAFGSNC